EELRSAYTEFAPKIVDILTRARELDAEVRRVRSAKPFLETGEPPDGRDLYETELVARGYTHLGQHGLSLDRDLVLPDFVTPSQKIWPPYEVPLSVRAAESMQAMFQRMPRPGSQEEYDARVKAAREQAEQQAEHYERLKREEREAY